jgi:hypothetical protein
MGSQRIQRVAAASSGTDAAQWQQVQDLVTATVDGHTYKNAVDMATAGALAAVTYNAGAGTLTANANGAMAAVDAITPDNGHYLLIKNQASSFQDGIYVVTDKGSAGTPFILTRRSDANSVAELQDGTTVFVRFGSANLDKQFTQVNSIANLTADAQSWTNTSGTAYTAGNGLGLSANAFSITLDSASGMTVSGSGLKNDWSVTARKASQDSAASTSTTLTHNWGTRDVHVSVRDTTTHSLEYPDVVLGTNDVTVTWPSAVGAGAKRITVVG